MSVLDILLQKKVITRDDIREVRKQTAAGTRLDDALVARGVKPEDILAAQGEFLNIPIRTVPDNSVPYSVLEYIPEESAVHYQIVPLAFVDGVLDVGIVDADNMEARDALNFLASKKNVPYRIFLISLDDFHKVLEVYKGSMGEVNQALSELESELNIDANTDTFKPVDKGKEGGKGGMKEPLIIEDAPVTKIVNTIVSYAVEGDASDVHIERMRDNVRVRYRVDGILNTTFIFPANVHSSLVARIKVICGSTGNSNMRLDEKRKPQDGRFSTNIAGRQVDFRVSTFPSYYGEKVEMRILDQAKGVLSIDKLGLSPRNLTLLREAINKPYGLILLTGPTGSGKSTTLYSIMNEMDRESYNILSLEEPVEYTIEGVSQSQIRPEIGYTFDTGLRTTLRQDPDIIMVGEIRDKETAQLAVQAALTGHLVLSTLHTNNAAGVIPRLIDMGVDPYLIAPTLVLAVGQRLVGLLAPNSGELVPVDGGIKALVDKSFADLPEEYKKDIPFSDQVYKIKPTPEAPKGTRGRMAVFEMFAMDKDIEQAILKLPNEAEISRLVRSKGMLTMKEDAMVKAFNKRIPFEEVIKL